ncbi:MAG: hypothetical protein II867_00625, partial [Clostridia bacterium]|nr:hypothetical protein [Clostridia bacterium]
MKNKLTVFVAILLIVGVLASFVACNKESSVVVNEEDDVKFLTNDELYANAVRDAVFVEEDEVLPLVNITHDDENVTWSGERVLVAFMHKYPDSYPAGEDIELRWGNVWCVSEKEMQNWVKNNAI